MRLFAEMLPIVTSNPTHVEQFSKKCVTCEQMTEELPAIRAAFDKVGHMEELMAENEWRLPDAERAHRRMITDDQDLLQSAIESATGTLEDDTKRFAKEVGDFIYGAGEAKNDTQ
jgi:hypothetical protein